MKQNCKLGDCVQLIQELPDRSVDMVLTSPPYDDLRSYGGYVFNCYDIAKQLYRVLKEGAVVVWVVGDATNDGSESGSSFMQALTFKECGFKLHDTMIYAKQNYTPLTHNRYEQEFEYMFVFSKGRPKTFNPIMIPCKNAGKSENYGPKRRSRLDKNQAMRIYDKKTVKATKDMKYHGNIFYYSCGTDEKTGHPAVFPEQLAKDMIITWSEEGEFVLDPYCGSGTTLKACRVLNRNALGYEINPEYIPIINNRSMINIPELSMFA